MTGLDQKLQRMIRETGWMMAALSRARAVDAPDWLIGGGVIRNLVWDRESGKNISTPLRDIDLAFFDAGDLSAEREARVERALDAEPSPAPWQAKNQARVHLWYEAKFGIPVEPLRSAADGVATWPETATSVAVRLWPDDRLQIVAPLGLEDLFGLRLRRNPRRVTPAVFLARLREKDITGHWPAVQVILD